MPASTTAPPTTIAASVVDGVKIYGTTSAAVRALDEVTVEIPSGRWTAIMGPSGSGKSTLLHCMAGLDVLTAGSASIAGHRLDELDDDALTVLRREQVGFVFQAFNLLPALTAVENLALPFTLAGRPVPRERVEAMLQTVGLADRADHRPAELSGGQQQRVAIARALVTEPAIVFADEPTGNLDSRAGLDVLAVLRDAVEQLGQTVAMVTHDPAAAAHADEVVFLADGRVVDHLAHPTAEAILDRMKRLGA